MENLKKKELEKKAIITGCGGNENTSITFEIVIPIIIFLILSLFTSIF